jgi:hypothetical protein
MRKFHESKAAAAAIAASGSGGAAAAGSTGIGGGRSSGGSGNTSSGVGGMREISTWRDRIDRRKKWDAKSEALQKEVSTIVRLIDTPIEGTHAEVTSERLARWQRAVELYVYCPEESGGVDFWKLLEKLIEGCGEVRARFISFSVHYLSSFIR